MDETNDRGAAAALDISNKPSPHGLKNKLGRLTWGVVQGTLFRFSPRPFKKWRVFLLRCFGANVSWKARIMPSATIWAPWNLEMDDYATLGDGGKNGCALWHIHHSRVTSLDDQKGVIV